MEKSLILEKLAARGPLFSKIPEIKIKRIMGFEQEYGVAQLGNGEPQIGFGENGHLAEFLSSNGGLVYRDREKLEYATPEVSNALEAVAYSEAGDIICTPYSERLYKHNVDWNGHTFGAHESYSTCLRRDNWIYLLPWFVMRQIIAGAGWQMMKKDEDSHYEISQRSYWMQDVDNDDTTQMRGIINRRKEPHSGIPGYERMHNISGDANLCPIANFLKVGLTSLFIEMLEDRNLPIINYKKDDAVSDIHNISLQHRDWYLYGARPNKIKATDLIRKYLKEAEYYKGRDEITDALLVIAEDTINKLDEEPKLLNGRLDWVTKKNILDEFTTQTPDRPPANLASLDLEYHLVHPYEGLYSWLMQNNQIERLMTDKLLEKAVSEPPEDTRALLRAYVQRGLKKEGKGKRVYSWSWRYLLVVDEEANYNEEYKKVHPNDIPHEWEVDMKDPAETYEYLIRDFEVNRREKSLLEKSDKIK